MSQREREAILEEQANLRSAVFFANREWAVDKDEPLFDETHARAFADYIWKRL